MKMPSLFALALCSQVFIGAQAYPLYGSEDRGIGRLEQARLAHEGKIPGRKRISGEILSLDQVDLRMTGQSTWEIPASDPKFSAKIRGLLGANAGRYGVSVLDLTNRAEPLYAEVGANVTRNPGSVGKMMVAVGLFQSLADAYPDDIDSRRRVLHDTIVTADEFIKTDSHRVRMWNSDTQKLTRRPLRVGDQGRLWEWLDWMLSASSNAAAATIQEQAMLLTHFGTAYPVSTEEKAAFLRDTSKTDLSALLERSVQRPLTRNGLDLTKLRQGSFFTRTGKRLVPGTSSYATPRELMKLVVRMEQGRLVDEFSSRELKRLLYMTERRIRYASAPALRSSAVYFKSGSWYGCQPEEGFVCKKYRGNKRNLMNSVAIVETPAGNEELFYIVTLTSNVLRKNSAVDHQTLATRIHRIIERRHGYKRP
ncbi:MAG: hypothetical protein ACI9W2_000423 [Gammaproteobacteria bacterium]|jgi:hypothetical protein